MVSRQLSCSSSSSSLKTITMGGAGPLGGPLSSSFPSITAANENVVHSLSHYCRPRRFTTTPSSSRDDEKEPNTPAPQNEEKNIIVYEGPFANMALRLKRISITTAIASIVGAPAIIFFGSNLPMSGQLAVGGTAIVAACGSTAALSFCFSPYIHTLEWIPVRKCHATTTAESNTATNTAEVQDKEEFNECQTFLLKATTRNLFSMKCETIFDPSQVKHIGEFQTYRPFCNFMVKDKHFFIHPELLQDDDLRIQLLGKEKGTLVPNHSGGMTDTKKNEKKKKDPDDDFL